MAPREQEQRGLPWAVIHLHYRSRREFTRIFCAVKRAEHTEFMRVISPWEREHLLLNV